MRINDNLVIMQIRTLRFSLSISVWLSSKMALYFAAIFSTKTVFAAKIEKTSHLFRDSIIWAKNNFE